ncbi:MAG: AMP-binding protein [Clostridia bacterium]|nr:AMP-binding protein [Clostridia bacterium]
MKLTEKLPFGKKKEDKVIEKPRSVKTYYKPKTKRLHVRVNDAADLYRIIVRHGDRIAFSYFGERRQVKEITYRDYGKMILRFAAGLSALGYAGKRVAIIGENSIYWSSAYLGTLSSGSVAIPMDRELEISVIEAFLESVDADVIVYSASFNGKFANAQKNHKSLSLFVPVAPDANEVGEKIVPFSDLLAKGKQAVKDGYALPPVTNRDALAEMLFTSGTTGTSKCVMLSQKNIFSVVNAALDAVDFNPDDVVVSVLPVHHTYELAIMLAELDLGIHVCIKDSLTHVLKNFQLFKPTGLVLVPLFVYTMYKKIWSEAKKTGRDKILRLGLGASNAMRTVGLDKRSAIFADVQNAFGGRLEKIICGGAALNPKMIAFFENIGISIYEGFGITECAPLTCVTPYYARRYGSVGPAVNCCQCRIEQTGVHSSGYPEGELQIKGDNVMLGYYNNPEANHDAFTIDGWFRTGDMAYMDDDGYVYITGRLKTVIVLENGKNIFPEEIEEYLGDIDTIAECVVVGRQSGSTVNLTAIIYPDFTKYPDGTSMETIKASIEKSIHSMNKRLPSHKHVKLVELRPTEFEKTTSRKIKRHLVK